MTTTTAHRKLTQAELVAEATERFGKDPINWAFVCPSCGDVATGGDFREALVEKPRKHHTGADVIASDVVGQECIGRTLGVLEKGRGTYTGRGCDWVAYGLFGGPWTITLPDGRSMHAFPLAPSA
ncbi:VVA0879 family protein [Streptomyces sp. QTS137]